MTKNGILVALSMSDKTSFGRDEFETQSIPQKVFSSIWAVEAEVNNGGFSQYFLNSSSETAGFVAEALERIGAMRTADICRRAVAIAFPLGIPADSDAINTAATHFSEEIEEKLNALNLEFFQYPQDLTALLFSYVSKYPEEFGELPEPLDA
jgi:hypothetical protein